ncbi:Uncharacterized protein PBTT_00611 [Plasmodiophora brassicae]|uniref:Uncharacterized protein n=1 Tax=Plasmodiophora brassicae TaxID=37360 RepID=A0A0G4J2H2_PLABS|nr:secrectory protein [Plasmodiophora brassicae]CEP01496.1 hypothetical protein PBRA_002100 [Plasmodiophora brassicae]SPQ93225.1 unnamed protein product [Plasmodiophora brassicae]
MLSAMLSARAAVVVVAAIVLAAGALCSNDLEREYEQRMKELQAERARLQDLTNAQLAACAKLKRMERRPLDRMIKEQSDKVDKIFNKTKEVLAKLVALRRAEQSAQAGSSRPLPVKSRNVEKDLAQHGKMSMKVVKDALLRTAVPVRSGLQHAASDDGGDHKDGANNLPTAEIAGRNPEHSSDHCNVDYRCQNTVHADYQARLIEKPNCLHSYFAAGGPVVSHAARGQTSSGAIPGGATVTNTDDDLASVASDTPSNVDPALSFDDWDIVPRGDLDAGGWTVL